MARILQATPPHLNLLAGYLSQGEIVAVPTETVYGLAGNALNPDAVAKIYKAKGRPARNPLIVHICSEVQLNEIARVSEACTRLISQFWPGPLTVILPKKPVVPHTVTAGLETVAVRMPSHPVFRQLAERCSFPLAAPSANPFGYVSPTLAEHVENHLGDRIDWILDGGPCHGGIESTILSLVEPGRPVLLRHGGISIDQLEQGLGYPIQQVEVNSGENEDEGLIAPGLMKRHYSPHARVHLFEKETPDAGTTDAVLFLSSDQCRKDNHFSLSSNGELTEVARNLYHRLQTLDQNGFENIYLELPEAVGIGQAIRDRMKRAAAQD